jgi:hypothetical protein
MFIWVHSPLFPTGSKYIAYAIRKRLPKTVEDSKFLVHNTKEWLLGNRKIMCG